MMGKCGKHKGRISRNRSGSGRRLNEGGSVSGDVIKCGYAIIGLADGEHGWNIGWERECVLS